MKEKLELRKNSYEINESYNKHSNTNVVLIMNRSDVFVRLMEPLSHFVFFHYIGTARTIIALFYHLLHRFCENVITLGIVLIFIISEFNCLFCEIYNNRNIEHDSYVLVYIHVCVITSLLSPILFYFFIKSFTTIQYLISLLVWNRNDYAEWSTLLQESNSNITNITNRINNRNDTNIVVQRYVSITG